MVNISLVAWPNKFTWLINNYKNKAGLPKNMRKWLPRTIPYCSMALQSSSGHRT